MKLFEYQRLKTGAKGIQEAFTSLLMKLFEYQSFETGPYIRFWRIELFLFRRCYWDWRWGLDADGAPALCTPWFILYMPWGG